MIDGPGAHRLCALVAGNAHQAAERLQQRVVARRALQRTFGAEGGQIAIDQLRLVLTKRRGIELIALDQPGPHVLHHDVGVLEDVAPQRLALGIVLQVQRRRILVAVDGLKHAGGAVQERRTPVARVVAALRIFDLDHGGAEFGQHQSGDRRGDAVAQFDDDDIFERQFHGAQRSCQRAR